MSLARGERVLAADQDADGGWVIATDVALEYGGRRIEWTDVARAGWDEDSSTLRVETMSGGNDAADVLRMVLPAPHFLPETVRERVDSSIVASRRVNVRGGSGVRVVVRRAPRVEKLIWQVVVDRNVDWDDPQVQAVSEQVVEELRRELFE